MTDKQFQRRVNSVIKTNGFKRLPQVDVEEMENEGSRTEHMYVHSEDIHTKPVILIEHKGRLKVLTDYRAEAMATVMLKQMGLTVPK